MKVTICMNLQEIKHLIAKFGNSYKIQPITIEYCKDNDQKDIPLYMVTFEIRDSIDALYVFQAGKNAAQEIYSKLK